MRIPRPTALMGLTAMALGALMLSVGGCMKGNKPQLDVPPPPLAPPSDQYLAQLVEPVMISEVADPSPLVDQRLVSGENGLGESLYVDCEPRLCRRTAQLLGQAQALAQQRGYFIVVVDAGRTPEAHEALVAMAGNPELVPAPEEDKGYPDDRGAAVDVTLLDARNGDIELAMGTRYMEMAEASNRRFPDLDREHISNRVALTNIMTDSGFEEGPAWWDFHDPGWRRYPEMDDEDIDYTLSPAAEQALTEARNPSLEEPTDLDAEAGQAETSEDAL
ncbi:MAG: hypothetical protein GF320_07030 [Armatimonadia bacterium]|nr:hypothetical protein [Armatimonadia bacterium]